MRGSVTRRLVVVAVVVRHEGADPAPAGALPSAGRPAQSYLGRVFPGVSVARAPDVGPDQGRVVPAGLLPDGTVYGVRWRQAGARQVVEAVTADLRTGRLTVVARGDPVVQPSFVAANERWLLGVTREPPAGFHVGHGCDLAPTPCPGTPIPPPHYWCHDRATGRTVDVTAPLRSAGSQLGTGLVVPDVSVIDTALVLRAGPPDRPRQLAMAGCAAVPQALGFTLLPGSHRLGPDLVLSLEDRFTQGHRVLAQDTRSGLTRTVLDGSGPGAVANGYGLVWDGGRDGARFARWGGTARSLAVPALAGEGPLTPVAAGERVFLLADRTRPLGRLALYDPVRDTLVRLGEARAQEPWTSVWAAGRYVLWDGGAGSYSWLDLGSGPAPPAPALDDLRIAP